MSGETLLHRIIKSDWWLQHGAVSSQAFRPGVSDHGQLSVFDGEQITAEESWRRYTKDPGRQLPVGVLSVTANECSNLKLPVLPDPDTFPEHMLIDFRGFGRNQVRKKASRLRDCAMARNWQYRPSEDSC